MVVVLVIGILLEIAAAVYISTEYLKEKKYS